MRRTGRCADLGREVGQGGEVVAYDRGGIGEAAAGELHPVTGVAGEPHDHAIDLLECLLLHNGPGDEARAECSHLAGRPNAPLGASGPRLG
jgi:hypothetical protein